MTKFTTFQSQRYGKITTVQSADGNFLLNFYDVCQALKYQSPQTLAQRLDRAGVYRIDGMRYISLKNLQLITKTSHKVGANDYYNWVLSVVRECPLKEEYQEKGRGDMPLLCTLYRDMLKTLDKVPDISVLPIREWEKLINPIFSLLDNKIAQIALSRH